MKNMKMMAAGMCLLTVVSCQTKQGSGALIGGGAGEAGDDTPLSAKHDEYFEEDV